jgi:hypothetical protein
MRCVCIALGAVSLTNRRADRVAFHFFTHADVIGEFFARVYMTPHRDDFSKSIVIFLISLSRGAQVLAA